MTTTPWGKGRVVAKASVHQNAGEREFSTLLELVELGSGERVVRLAYSTDGAARRGPVTLRARDIQRLTTLVRRNQELLSTIKATTSGGTANGKVGGARARNGR